MSHGPTRRALGKLAADLRELARIRWVRVVLVLFLLALGTRVGLETLLGFTVNRLAAQRDLVCEWEDLDISILFGRGELNHLEIRPQNAEGEADPQPLVNLEYGLFDLSILSLLKGQIRVTRAEVDGMDSWLIRDAEGLWNLERHVAVAELLALLEAPEEPEEPEEPESDEDQPLSLALPFAIDALRFQDARLHLVDQSLESPVDVVVGVNAQLSHLNRSDRPARFSAVVTGGDVLDGAHVVGEATWAEEQLLLDLDAQFGSLRLRTFEPYLALLGIRPVGESLEGRLSASLELDVIGEARDALSARASLGEVRLLADGTEELGLRGLSVQVESVSAERMTVGAIEITAGHAAVSLEASGALRAAGLELIPAAPAVTPVAPAQGADAGQDPLASLAQLLQPREVPAFLALLVSRDPEAYPWSIASITVQESQVAFTDRSVVPEAELQLAVERVNLRDIVHDPDAVEPSIPIDMRLSAPGLAESIRVTGEVTPFAPKRSLDLGLEVEGIHLEELEGHLKSAGLERNLESAGFSVRLAGEAQTGPDGRTEGWLRLDQSADSGEAEQESALGVRQLAADGIVFDPSGPLLRLGNLTVSGPRLTLGRDSEHRFFALGLRTLGLAAKAPDDSRAQELPGATTAPEEQVAVSGSASGQADPALPLRGRLEIGRLAWGDTRIQFLDELSDPPVVISVDQLDFELLGLVLDVDPEAALPEPARLSGRMRARGLIEELTAEGTLQTHPGRLDLATRIALRGRDLRGKLAGPYMRALGIEPILDNGDLTLDLEADMRLESGVVRANLALRDASLVDAGTRLLAVEELRIDDVELGDGIHVGEIAVVRPFASLALDAEGQLVAGGLRTVSKPAGASAELVDPAAVAAAPAYPQLSLPALPGLRVDSLRIEGAALAFANASVEPALEVELRADVNAKLLGTRGLPGTFDARFSVPGTADSIETRGEISLGLDAIEISTSVAGQGFHSGALAPFLPPGVEIDAGEAMLTLDLEARVEPSQSGGLLAQFVASDFSWGEGAVPWIGFTSARVEAQRLDPAGGVLEVGPLALEGLRVAASRDAQGVIHALGLRIDPGAELPEATPEALAQTEQPAQPAQPATPKRASSPPLPRILLQEDISFELEQFSFHDATLGPEARPLEGSLSFRLVGERVLVDADTEDLAALEWVLEGQMPGLVERWKVAGSITPFAPEPLLEATLEADGVRTAGVLEIAPELAGMLTGEVEQGRIEGHLAGTLFVKRTHATDLGLGRPFGAELRLDGLAYRDAPDGTILAGIDEVLAEVKRVDLARGLIHVQALELVRPRGILRRQGNVVRALGFALDTEQIAQAEPDEAPDPEMPGSEAATDATSDATSVSLPVEAAAGVNAPGDEAETGAKDPGVGRKPEVRIDLLTISGIDFELHDTTGEPALVLPLDQLDVEVKRFTTRALEEPHPIQFAAYLESGAEDQEAVFEEVAVSGRVALVPMPSGWAQVSLSGLDLAAFSGMTGSEVVLEGGALDASARIRLKGESGATLDSSVVFTDLNVDEPEGGPIQTALSLPVTLDAALFVLRNPRGEHRFSTDISVPAEGIGSGGIALAATKAFAEVLARALAGVPMRLLTSIIPGGSKETLREPRRTVRLAFAPGATELDQTAAATLDELVRTLEGEKDLVAVLRHTLTEADVERARGLANPPHETCLELAAGLRQEKAKLLRRRDELATEAYTLHALGSPEARAVVEQLRAAEQGHASVEGALDELFEILRSDSPRRKERRTRGTARELSVLRLEAAADVLRPRLGKAASERIELRSPRFEPTDAEGGGAVVIELYERP